VPSPPLDRNGSNEVDRSPSETYILLDWEGPLDPHHPRNWSLSSKIWICVIVFINVFVPDWCFSTDSQTGSRIANEFGVSRVAESLSSALYVFGTATGAIFAGPISETVGRNPFYLGSRVLHLTFIHGSALAPNLTTQLVCRFLAGLGASIILAIHGASIADIFGPEGRSLTFPPVALSSFLDEFQTLPQKTSVLTRNRNFFLSYCQ
jgi:MFS transporter, DHA1 family, multidrug resistance protein